MATFLLSAIRRGSGQEADYSSEIQAVVKDVVDYLVDCSAKMKTIDYRKNKPFYSYALRHLGGDDINAAGNAMMYLLLACKYISKK
jgi:hypothetical protein